jgi:hypothetical protein
MNTGSTITYGTTIGACSLVVFIAVNVSGSINRDCPSDPLTNFHLAKGRNFDRHGVAVVVVG